MSHSHCAKFNPQHICQVTRGESRRPKHQRPAVLSRASPWWLDPAHAGRCCCTCHTWNLDITFFELFISISRLQMFHLEFIKCHLYNMKIYVCVSINWYYLRTLWSRIVCLSSIHSIWNILGVVPWKCHPLRAMEHKRCKIGNLELTPGVALIIFQQRLFAPWVVVGRCWWHFWHLPELWQPGDPKSL